MQRYEINSHGLLIKSEAGDLCKYIEVEIENEKKDKKLALLREVAKMAKNYILTQDQHVSQQINAIIKLKDAVNKLEAADVAKVD